MRKQPIVQVLRCPQLEIKRGLILKTQSRKTENGFSLVELLLTLVLVLCLAAASVFSYTALHRSANLDEGVNRLESLIRFAQAEAATTGCKVRLQFEPGAESLESGQAELRKIKVTWEPDFLNSPGVFQVYTNKSWSEEIVNEIVGVAKVRPVGASTAQVPRAATEISGALEPLEAGEMEFAMDFPGITFYPDGSCDSAELILASRNPEDARRVEVTLSGILGSVSSRVVSASSVEQTEDFLEEDYMEEEYMTEEYMEDDFMDQTPDPGFSPADTSYSDSSFSTDFSSDIVP